MGKMTAAIERWKRGLAATAFLAFAVGAAIIAVGLPMFIIGEVLNYRPLQHLSNIVPVALLLALPWIITGSGAASAIRQVLDEKRT